MKKPEPQIILTLNGAIQMSMYWIPPGTFMMGSPETESGRLEDEGPQHEVTLSRGFYLGSTVVTQAQWFCVMETQPWRGRSMVREAPNSPAVYVSWHGAQDFVARLNASGERLKFRLPTEAEWEYACRAGSSTTWPWGEEPDAMGTHAWFGENAWQANERYAHWVASRKPSAWQLYDMLGNVREWTADGWREYADRPVSDPTGETDGDRMLKGGDFGRMAEDIRPAARDSVSPRMQSADIGFRIVADSHMDGC